MYVYINDKLYEMTKNFVSLYGCSCLRFYDAATADWTGSCDDKIWVTDSEDPDPYDQMFSFSAIFRALKVWGDVYWSLREY